jgi:hypothetical protein
MIIKIAYDVKKPQLGRKIRSDGNLLLRKSRSWQFFDRRSANLQYFLLNFLKILVTKILVT